MDIDTNYYRQPPTHNSSKRQTDHPSSKRQKTEELHSQPITSISSFKLFMDTQDDYITEQDAVSLYNQYKDSCNKLHLKQFFHKHQSEEWLKKRYHPSQVDCTKEMGQKNRLVRKMVFKWIYEHNYLDISLDEDNCSKLYYWLRIVALLITNPDMMESSHTLFDIIDQPEAIEDKLIFFETFLIFLTSFPSNTSQEEISGMFAGIEGFEGLVLCPPRAVDEWKMNAFAVFQPKTSLTTIIRRMDHQNIRVIVSTPSPKSVIPVEGSFCEERVLIKDIGRAINIIKHYEGSDVLQMDEFTQVILTSGDEIDNLERQHLIKILDCLVLYLRVVYSFDYYGCMSYQYESSFPRALSVLHVRRDNSTKQCDMDAEYYKLFGTGMELSEEDGFRLGRKDENEEIDKFMREHCQQLDDSRFMCTLSNKMFMSEDFVHKHITRKYADKITLIRENVGYFNNFIMDNNRPLPTLPIKTTRFSTNETSPRRHHRQRSYKNEYSEQTWKHAPTTAGRHHNNSRFDGPRRTEYHDFDAPESFNL